MEQLGHVLMSTLTAPLWVPGYVVMVAMRWALGRDQSNDAQ